MSVYGLGMYIGTDDNPTSTPTTNSKIGIGVQVPTAVLDLRASTTAEAIMRLRVCSTPTTPNDGDIWYDGTDLKMRIGGGN